MWFFWGLLCLLVGLFVLFLAFSFFVLLFFFFFFFSFCILLLFFFRLWFSVLNHHHCFSSGPQGICFFRTSRHPDIQTSTGDIINNNRQITNI